MSRASHETTFSTQKVQQMLGLSRSVIDGLVDAGFVSPERGARNAHRFSFQDLMLLRTAHGLQQARVAPRKILAALAKLRANLPDAMPLTGLRITAVGAHVVVRDREGPREVDSGQYLIDFEVAPRGEALAFGPAAPQEHDPSFWFRRGEEAEMRDPPAAEAAYRKAIDLAPEHVDAYLNLGALLCEASRCDEASSLYEAALARGLDHPLVHFNHAIAQEDQQRWPEALASYERALEIDPDFADAHYNAGRLRETLGDAQGAVRHFSAYRRLERSR